MDRSLVVKINSQNPNKILVHLQINCEKLAVATLLSFCKKVIKVDKSYDELFIQEKLNCVNYYKMLRIKSAQTKQLNKEKNNTSLWNYYFHAK